MSIKWNFVRYATVGFCVNLSIYLLYLLITSQGVGHKTAMTGLYIAAVLTSFTLNSLWTFKRKNLRVDAFFRYALVYIGGYILNLAGLITFVDMLGYPHQAVQGVLIISNAVLLFLSQHFWVFPASGKNSFTDGRA